MRVHPDNLTHATPRQQQTIQVVSDGWAEYELLDAGHRRKLERLGPYVMIREETKAWWEPALSDREWQQAVAIHAGEEQGRWDFRNSVPREWQVRFENLTLQARFTATSKHVGVFPEQAAHWHWIAAQLQQAQGRERRVLNLFGYTGIASLVAAAQGSRVTHVDAAKGVVSWARHNQQLSGLEDAPIRWIVDDVSKFVKREIRRNRQYEAILLDPPSFGRGPKREVWKIEQHLVDLLADCRKLLSDAPLFVILTMYSIDQSAILIGNLLQDMMHGAG
ncbi:class I SAM-dependent rRNA methyltransferase, partial [candidate division KSB3 bacterium]|nr:class I SAM-dependent rRNA methyltransferase [candidate division KSB3 bacterium]MBD3323475.1 class I SAM-dependent rRNA methyltransferase [candidate division KSB3 bacterium]